MLERVIALAVLIFGLVWAASVLGTPSAPAPADELPEAPPPPVDDPREERPAAPAPAKPPPRPQPEPSGGGLLGGLLGSPPRR